MRNSLVLLKRLHWATWCAMLLTAVPLVLIMVPGETFYFDPKTNSPAWNDACTELETITYQRSIDAMRLSGAFSDAESSMCPPDLVIVEHGWPRPYLARAVVNDAPFPTDTGFGNISWANLRNWPFSAENWIIRPGAFLFDLGFAVILIGGVGGLTEWRVRSRGDLLKFRLIDLLIGITILGIGLGYYTYHRRIYVREFLPPSKDTSFGMAFLSASYGKGTIRPLQEYVGPIWLWKLCGGASFMDVFYHNTSVTIWPDEDWQQNYALLPMFPYLDHIIVRNGLPLDAIKELEKCSRLKALILPRLPSDGPTVVEGTNDPLFQPKHLAQLENLSLKLLALRGSAITYQHVELVAGFPNIETIYLYQTSISDTQLQNLQQRFPQVTIENFEY